MHRSGGHHHRIDPVESRHRDGAQAVDLMAVAHQPMRGDIARGGDNAPHGRIDRCVGMRIDEFAYGGVSLRSPTRRRRAAWRAARNGVKSMVTTWTPASANRLDSGVERSAPLAIQLRQLRRQSQPRDWVAPRAERRKAIGDHLRTQPSLPWRGSRGPAFCAKIVTQS